MSTEQIRLWADRGLEFGAHSRTHPDLRKLSGPALEEEVAGSRADLEHILNRQVLSFAYPLGYHDEAVRACVSRHFELAFTTDEQMNHLENDIYSLGRTMVRPDDSALTFASRVAFGWPPIARLRSRLRIRTRAASAWRALQT